MLMILRRLFKKQGQQIVYLLALLSGMTQGSIEMNGVTIAATLANALNIAFLFQIAQDALHSAFSNPNHLRNLSGSPMIIARHTKKNLCMVR